MTIRFSRVLLAACAIAATAFVPVVAKAQSSGSWQVPRTAYGHPDLQGNWTNATITPIQRPEGQGPTLTPEQVQEVEGQREERIEEEAAPTDPDRTAPPVGGDGSTGAAGGVGGYNYFWIDAGDRVAVVNGEYRSSLITFPENGRMPDRTPQVRERMMARRAALRGMGAYDNPENRPASERCIVSFGSNAGPPMTPNYFYNNNYTIVQTPDYVMIHTEMVHDTRIVRMGERTNPLPENITPWFGDSWGHWEGDTLVVETTNIREDQAFQGVPATPDLKVTERFALADQNTINYRFTIHDPTSFVSDWGGEIPYHRLSGLVYEYACHEGNYALANVLSGARAEERRAAENQPNTR